MIAEFFSQEGGLPSWLGPTATHTATGVLLIAMACYWKESRDMRKDHAKERREDRDEFISAMRQMGERFAQAVCESNDRVKESNERIEKSVSDLALELRTNNRREAV